MEWISIRHLANIESSIEKLFALAIALEEDPVDLFEEIMLAYQNRPGR